MKKSNPTIMIITIILAVALIIGGLLGYVIYKKIQKEYFLTETLTISIKNVSYKNYFIYLPVLIYNDEITEIFKELTFIKGVGSYEFIDTSYGKMINISSADEVILHSIYTLSSNRIQDTEKYFESECDWSAIKKEKRSEVELYVFGNGNGNSYDKINIEIDYSAKSNTGTSYEGERVSRFSGEILLNNEWQTIKGIDWGILA